MICKRGVLYVTPVCNLRCKFCYYRFLDDGKRRHTPLEVLKQEADRQRFDYFLDSTDLTGFGEPTIHPDITELVKYCAKIGLEPTIITNGQSTDKILELLDNGLKDILLSIHDLGKDYEELVGVKGSWKKMENTLKKLKERDFRFRANITVIESNRKHLKKIVEEIKEYGGRMVDFILFNPHEGTDWAKHDNKFQAKYSEASESIKEAIDLAEKEGLIANVRYIPICMMKGYEKHVINFHQWIFDKYGWEESHGNRLPRFENPKQHLEFVKKKCSINKYPKCCEGCANINICDGIYPQYLNKFGEGEFKAKGGNMIVNPMFYRLDFLKKYTMEYK